MKRFLLLCLLALLPIVSFAQKAQKFELAPFEFEIRGDNSVALVGYDSKYDTNQVEINIPSSVNYKSKQYNVTSIECGSSVKYSYFPKRITAINIPSTVTNIGNWTFCFLGDIKSISIPNSVTTIGNYAFRNMSNLDSIVIPESVTTIGLGAFSGCTQLRSVEVFSPQINIQNSAFGSCYNLCIITIHSDYLNMSDDTFYKTKNLNEIQVKAAVRPYVTIKDNNLNPKPLITIIDEPQQTAAPTNIYIASTPAVQQPIEETPKIISDVDQNIPQTSLKNENTFAVIIANEKYTNVSNVDYAAQDGRIFAEYCKQTLGIPEKNIKLIEDASLGAIVSNVDWLHNVLKAYGGSAKAIFYYSGHGIPNHETGDSYLLPTDCPPNNYNVAYKLQDLYNKLGEAGGDVTYFIDACFSGMKRQGEVMVAARGVAIKAKPSSPIGSSVVFSAASGDQTAFAYDEKGHGIFTYFLLKKIQESKGNINYGELANYIQSEVAKVAIVERSVPQTPTITHSSSLQDSWQGWKFIK